MYQHANSSDEETRIKGLRLKGKVIKQLEEFSKLLGLGEGESMEYLIGLAFKYRMYEVNWKKHVLDDIIANLELRKEYSKDLEVFKAELSLEMEKQSKLLNWKWELLKMYLKDLDPEERKRWIEGALGYIGEGAKVEELLMGLEVVKVDGKVRMLKMKDGIPILPESPNVQLIKCPEGYHVKGRLCNCRAWRECSIRMEERVEYKAEIELGKFQRLKKSQEVMGV